MPALISCDKQLEVSDRCILPAHVSEWCSCCGSRRSCQRRGQCVCCGGNGVSLCSPGLFTPGFFSALTAGWKGAKGREREIHLRCCMARDAAPVRSGLFSRGGKWGLCSWSIPEQTQKAERCRADTRSLSSPGLDSTSGRRDSGGLQALRTHECNRGMGQRPAGDPEVILLLKGKKM